MPRIPSIAPQAIGTQPLSAPGIEPVQDQTGRQLQALGGAVAEAGLGGASALQRMQVVYDDGKTAQADALAAEAVEKGLYSPDGGYLNLQGERAIGKSREEAFTAISKELTRIGTTLDNDAQRTVYAEQSARRLREASFKADVHEANQKRVFAIGSLKARGDIVMKDAVDHYGTAEYEVQRAAFLDIVDRLVDLQGGGEDEKKLGRLNALSTLNSENIQQLVEQQDPVRAKELLDKAVKAGELQPDAQRKMTALVGKAMVEDQAYTVARDAQRATGTLTDQLDLLQKQADEGTIPVEVYKAARQQVEHDAEVRQRDEGRRHAQALQQAVEWAQSGSPLTPQLAQALDDTGQAWKYDALVDAGGLYRTTGYGFRELQTISQDRLLAFPTADAVFSYYRTEMDNDDLGRMVAKWHAAQVASGRADQRSQQQQQADLVNATLADESEYYFRRLPGSDPNWTDIPKHKQAQLAEWKRNFRIEVNAIGREKGLKEATTEVYEAAYERIVKRNREMGTKADGDAAVLEALTLGERETATIQLSPRVAKRLGKDTFTLRRADKELLDRAAAALAEELGTQEEIPMALVYNRAAEFVAAENEEQQKVVTDARARGMNLMSERVRSAVDNPEIAKRAWRMANERGGGLASPEGYRSRWTGKVLEPSESALQRATMEVMMDSFGWALADEFGIEREEMWDAIAHNYRAARIEKRRSEGGKSDLESYLDSAPVTPTPMRKAP